MGMARHTDDRHRERRARNIALLAVLLGLAALFYAVTIIKMGVQ
jgi:hypothetical protein